MELCAHCKAQETQLYESGVPICLSCANTRDAELKQAEQKRTATANGNIETQQASEG